jgi:serine/threonine protein kinase
VQVLGLCKTATDLYMIMEFASAGSLDRLMVKEQLSSNEKISIIHGVAKGVAHLHRYRIVHRDLACRNVLVNAGRIPKVADFGMSRIIDKFELKGTTACVIDR